jgi:hypothetical protein
VSEPGGLESIEVASSGERLAGCIEGRVKRGRLERSSRAEQGRAEQLVLTSRSTFGLVAAFGFGARV